MAASDGEERGPMSLLQYQENRLRCDEKCQCQTYGCDKQINFYCKSCKTFLCVRCGDLSCETEGDKHNAVDIRICVIESKEAFELWKSSRLRNVAELELQKQKIAKKVKLLAQQLVDAPDSDSVCEILERISTEMSAANRDLQDNKMEMEQEVRNLNLMEKLMNNASGSEVELIHFAKKVQVVEQAGRVVLGPYESFGTDRECYDISISPAGHLVAGGVGGLDIIQADTGEFIKTIPIDEESQVFTVEPYKDTIIVGVTKGKKDVRHRDEVITYDLNFEEIGRWSATRNSTDLAAVNNEILIANGLDQFSGSISVFNLDGTASADIVWSGIPFGLVSIPPCSIMFSDKTINMVYKYCITLDRRGVVWSAPVVKPECIALDEKGNIWIYSQVNNNCITVLSRYGDVIQEIGGVTRFRAIMDLCIHKEYLYVAHEEGTGRYKLNWETISDIG